MSDSISRMRCGCVHAMWVDFSGSARVKILQNCDDHKPLYEAYSQKVTQESQVYDKWWNPVAEPKDTGTESE